MEGGVKTEKDPDVVPAADFTSPATVCASDTAVTVSGDSNLMEAPGRVRQKCRKVRIEPFGNSPANRKGTAGNRTVMPDEIPGKLLLRMHVHGTFPIKDNRGLQSALCDGAVDGEIICLWLI